MAIERNPLIRRKEPTLIAYLPQDRWNEYQLLMARLANHEIPDEEFEDRLKDIVFPFLPRHPNDGDHTEIRLAQPKIQVLKPTETGLHSLKSR